MTLSCKNTIVSQERKRWNNLNERYAKGEIDEETYRIKKETLNEQPISDKIYIGDEVSEN